MANVEFRLASIDRMPLPDGFADCVISNCVINLAPDKPAVFREIVRILKPGGRLAVSDIALKMPLPEALASEVAAYVGCISGAIPIEEYRRQLIAAGFDAVEIIDSGTDLNAYAKIENQSGCCSPSMDEASATGGADAAQARSLPVANAGCCTPSGEQASFHGRLAGLLQQYDVNNYAASVKVFAVKPASNDAMPR
jgi:hypothetical protein